MQLQGQTWTTLTAAPRGHNPEAEYPTVMAQIRTAAGKVVHLTSAHSSADVRIFHKECKTLADAGYEVVLIAGQDGGAICHNVRIDILPAAIGRGQRMTRSVARIFNRALRERADLYHFHDPELIPVGLCLKMAGHRVVYDVHEDVPKQIMSKSWIRPQLRSGVSGTVAAIERLGERCFDGLVAATPSIACRFRPDRTVIVQNFPILEEFNIHREPPPYHSRPPLLAYVGGLEEIRGVREMLEAMALLPADLKARLQLAGTFASPAFEASCRAMPGWRQTDHLGWQTRPEVVALLGRARAGLVLLRPTPNYVEAQPVKLFEYMAAGLPVVASDFPLWRRIVEGAGCGILVDPTDPRAIADALTWLLTHPDEASAMGARGRAAVMTTYNWNTEAKKLLAFYARILSQKR